jgi:hypothetical protein
MQNKIYQIFTHKDLDGAGSLLAFIWSHPDATISFTEIGNNEIFKIKEYIKKTINPASILVFDLSLRDEFLPELDIENITYIDHHKRSENNISKFKKAKIIYKDFSSNTLLIRKLFKDKQNIDLDDKKKKLLLLIDDFDCGKKQFSSSYDLNIIFWTQFKNKFADFIIFYKDGFVDFTEKQLKIIKTTKQNAEKSLNEMKYFSGELLIDGFPRKTLACLTNQTNLIVIDKIMNNNDENLFLFINTETQTVSIRQKKCNSMIDLPNFSRKYCDGDGSLLNCGGKITPLFMELTKKLNPI